MAKFIRIEQAKGVYIGRFLNDRPGHAQMQPNAFAFGDGVFVDHRVRAYAVQLVTATRDPAEAGLADLAPYLELGGSPRASLSLIRGARALAVMRGRSYVLPEDVAALFHDALRHRVVLSYEALAAEVQPDQVLDRIVSAIPQPEVEIGGGRSVA